MRRILTILCLMLTAGSAFGQSTNLLKNPNGDEGLQSWRVFGNASVTDCYASSKCFGIYQNGYILQDMSVPEKTVGMFAVLIAFTSIEETTNRPLGRPYLYGYMMDGGEPRGGNIFAYLHEQNMNFQPGSRGEWVKQYGVFKVPEKTGRIRMFLRAGCAKDQAQAECVSRFRLPGVFLFSTEDEARAFISAYQ